MTLARPPGWGWVRVVRRLATYWVRPVPWKDYAPPPVPTSTYNEAGHQADIALMLELARDHTLPPAVRNSVMKWVLRPGETT